MIKPSSRYAKSAFTHTLLVAEETCDVREPNSFSEVVSSQKFVELLSAMNEEIDSFHKSQT